jgi:hypothetical protein
VEESMIVLMLDTGRDGIRECLKLNGSAVKTNVMSHLLR